MEAISRAGARQLSPALAWAIGLLTLSILHRGEACSFLVANFNVDASMLERANELNKRRGPDATTRKDVGGWTLVHNLLWMTGEFTTQPFADANNSVLATYNGEIYNYKDLFPDRDFKSDGYSIIPAYQEFGEAFGQKLDGEFAISILDMVQGRLFLLTDPFGTKPLFFGYGAGGRFAAASYASVLEGLGFKSSSIFISNPNTLYSATFDELRNFRAAAKPLVERYRSQMKSETEKARFQKNNPHKMPQHGWPKRLKYRRIDPWPFLTTFPVVQWDLQQTKETTDDFVASFQRSVAKRTKGLIWPAFVGLSGGFDSGAIHLALSVAGFPHETFTVEGAEDSELINKRLKMGSQNASTRISLDKAIINEEASWIKRNVEKFTYEPPAVDWTTQTDKASVGLSAILKRCQKRKVKVYFSGSGGDEIISDYAAGGQSIYGTSDFGGRWPEDLAEIFPWRNFYWGQMRNYLMKEEMVGGAHSMETRYPFLDRDVVQEFLSLSPAIKNGGYKQCIKDFFVKHNYPFEEHKRGFAIVAAEKASEEEFFGHGTGGEYGPASPSSPALEEATTVQLSPPADAAETEPVQGKKKHKKDQESTVASGAAPESISDSVALEAKQPVVEGKEAGAPIQPAKEEKVTQGETSSTGKPTTERKRKKDKDKEKKKHKQHKDRKGKKHKKHDEETKKSASHEAAAGAPTEGALSEGTPDAPALVFREPAPPQLVRGPSPLTLLGCGIILAAAVMYLFRFRCCRPAKGRSARR